MSRPPFVRFKLRLGKGDFYWCYIFREKTDMLAHFRNERTLSHGMNGRQKARYKFAAIACYRDVLRKIKGHWRRSKCRGQVLFFSQFMGPGIVAHEMTHAASFRLEKDKRWSGITTKLGNEQMAALVGELVRQFYRGYWRWRPRKAWLR